MSISWKYLCHIRERHIMSYNSNNLFTFPYNSGHNKTNSLIYYFWLSTSTSNSESMSCVRTSKNQQKKHEKISQIWNKNFLFSWLHKKGTESALWFSESLQLWLMLLRLTAACVEMIESSHAFMSCWSIVYLTHSLTHFLTDYS